MERLSCLQIKPVDGVWPLRSVQAIFMAGRETGISVEVIAEEGETYPLHDGQKYPVGEGHAYVEIGAGRKHADLSKFWRRVEKTKGTRP